MPIFFRHIDWLDSIRTRSRSLGDCGYKPNLLGNYGDNLTEMITVSFQKLSQKGEPKGDEFQLQTVYEGERYTGDFRA